jgi:AcrR family transcriptional regulator
VTPVTARKSAEIRREEILQAAVKEFARSGLHGTSTEAIARRAGVSQPYLFRLYGTKKDLFLATCARCFELVLAAFQEAAEGLEGPEAM